MTRSSHSSVSFIFAFGFACIALFAFVTTPAAYAQRGVGSAHFGGGGHFAGAGHFSGGHFAPGHAMAGGHFAGARGGRVGGRVIAPRASSHLTYIRRLGTGQPLRRSFVQPYWHNRAHTRRFSVPFTTDFGYFGNGFFPYGVGLWGWGWWGDWGDDWDSTWPSECNWESNCENGQTNPEGYPESGVESEYEQPDESRPMIMVYLRDGSGFGALDYWLTNGSFHIETTYGTEKSFPLDDVDVHRTFTENTARGVTFTLSPNPMSSDPGPMFAPDSYAPDCPVPSPAPPPASSAPAVSASTPSSASWLGVTGTPSDRGLTVATVRPDSPAAQIGVRPGDLLVRINCQQIRSTQDIASAVTNTPGPVWVSFMIRGAWLTDKKIVR